MLKKNTIVSILALGLGLSCLFGCDQGQRGVIKDKATKAIDEALGENQVRLKRIEQVRDGIEESLFNMKTGRAEAQILAAKAQDKVLTLQSELEKWKEVGSKIIEAIKNEQFPVTIGSTTFNSVADARETATRLGNTIRPKEEVIKGQQLVLQTFLNTQEALGSRIKDGTEKLEKIKLRIDIVKSQITALEAQKAARIAAGAISETVPEAIKLATEDLDELSVSLERDLLVQKEEWNSMSREFNASNFSIDQFTDDKVKMDELEELFKN